MQALILAAGMGRRLGNLTESQTKCMLRLHGKTLIERSLDSLVAVGVDRAVLVVGHGALGVQALVGDEYCGIPITYVVNRDFATTNNIYSLYLARRQLKSDDTILLESDLVYDPSIVADLVADPRPNVAVVDRQRSWMDGTVVTLSDDDTIEQFVPKASMKNDSYDEYFKTVNIYKLSRKYLKDDFVPFLKAYVRSAGNNEYYEQVLRVIAGLDRQNLGAMRLKGERWYEIDDLQDYDIASTIFSPDDSAYDSYLSRHGGYWRFPELLDFCYLVNPYFPPTRMLEEMGRSFDTLLREYPSSLTVQNRLAAKLFQCNPDQVLVGNGAAELIAALGHVFRNERIGVPVPTFEEYLKRFPHSQVIPLPPSTPDLKPNVDRIIALSQDLDALVLINPDNPSGQCLSLEDVVSLADALESTGKRLILDESFVDFADPDYCRTLIDAEFLAAHPRTIVIKSISKSYGVPGARLGVMATADTALLLEAQALLPVWNINSMGEYFLQIIGKYQNEYADGCALVRSSRAALATQLAEVSNLKVHPSQANYLLVEVVGSATSREVANQLLLGHELLVKDATGKPGLPAGQFLRLAVRDEPDNTRLVKALTEVLG